MLKTPNEIYAAKFMKQPVDNNPSAEQTPGSLVRLLQTLTFFDSIPFGAMLGTLLFGTTPLTNALTPTPAENGMLLIDFRRPEHLQLWGALDDVVMGGVSASGLRPLTNGALFTGNVSTSNSGGFVSIRTKNLQPPLDLSGYAGIELRLKGDGNRYKFFLRSDDRWDGLGYAYSFNTVADEWMTVRIPFADLIPVRRAKTVPGEAAINRHQIYAFQLMLSKFEYDGALNPHFQAGVFKLELETIRAYN
jgi:hypothetical protein